MVPTAGKTARVAQLRYLNRPQAVAVTEDAYGEPLAVRMGEHSISVRRIRDCWRIDDQWWRDPVCRIYFDLELEDGQMLTVYHDRISGYWFRQRYG